MFPISVAVGRVDQSLLDLICFYSYLQRVMIMKIPNGTGSGYYGHDSSVRSYLSDSSDVGNGDDADLPTLDVDFSEYMWMENEEEFDKQVSYLVICRYLLTYIFHFLVGINAL
jgi:hypothetical protein